MFERILVPLDGSARAESALPIAARLARAAHGTVLLVEVVRGTAEFEVGVAPPKTWAPAADPKERRHASEYLKRLIASEALADVAVEPGVYAGAPVPTLLLVAARQRADLIVMTTRGRTGLVRWALGSVARGVAHEATVPVVLLHEAGETPASSGESVHRPVRALVPLDGSARAEAALGPAAQVVGALAAPGQGALHLVRVVDLYELIAAPDDGGGTAQAREVRAREWAVRRARAYLGTVAERLRGQLGARAPMLTWSVALDPQSGSFESDVAGAIVRTAEAGEPIEGATAPDRCDLIAMATHGYGGVERFIMGSVAERVLHASALPLLLVRSRGEGAAPSQEGAVATAVSDP